MDEKELQEFTLEDIMKEFGSSDTEQADPQMEEAVAELLLEETDATQDETAAVQEDPTVNREEAAQEPAVPQEESTVSAAEEPAMEEAQAPAVTGDTIRLDTPLTSGDTIRMEAVHFSKGDVRGAQHIEDEEEDAPIVIPQEETTEPYSEQWEPDYEQPIAEYVPPKPIVFHPRSKIRELKRKLVAGPEKQYYLLSEKGLGKIQAAAFFCFLLTLVSAAVTILFSAEMIKPERIKFVVFLQFLVMLLCALLGSSRLTQGLADLRRGRFSLNTLLGFTFLLCCADGVVGLMNRQIPCCAAFGLQMTLSLCNASQTHNATLGQLDTMRKATNLYGLTRCEDYSENGAGLLRMEGKVEDFMDNYLGLTKQDKVSAVYAPIAALISVGAGVLAAVLHSIPLAIRVASVTALAALPATMFIVTSRPMAILERRLHKVGSVICGWNGVANLRKNALFPISHEDIFPAGSVKLNGVKFYGDRESDQVVAYAAALVCADHGALVPIFEHLLDSRNGIHYDVDSYQAYAQGGIGGQVNGENVLVGTPQFLQEMGVQIPDGIRLNHAVGVSIEGSLCGIFALAYDKLKSVTAGLGTLSNYRGLQPTIVSGDFMLTEDFLKTKFGIRTKRVLFPEFSERFRMRGITAPEEATTLAIATNDSLSALAYSVTGSRALYTCARLGTIIHLIGGILGMGMMLVLAYLGAESYLTPVNLLLYQLIWLIPGTLITEWTRSV